MIDELVAGLAKEQQDDDHKKEYCEGQIDHLEDKKKELEHTIADLESLMASDTAAKDIIGFAKNRLNKFYNPKLYKAPPKRELTEEERITLNMGGTLAPTAAPGGIAG